MTDASEVRQPGREPTGASWAWLLAGLAALVLCAGITRALRRASPTSNPRGRSGSERDRGQGDPVALDVEGLRGHRGTEPLVQYLTYIRSRRGEASHLLFVRNEDLEAMAELEGLPLHDFLRRLRSFGVVVSQN